MARLALVGWQVGVQTIPLVLATRDACRLSLTSAKSAIDRLLAGEEVLLEFDSELESEEYRKIAEQLGAIVRAVPK